MTSIAYYQDKRFHGDLNDTTCYIRDNKKERKKDTRMNNAKRVDMTTA